MNSPNLNSPHSETLPLAALQVLLVEDSKVLSERLVEAVSHVEGAALVGCVDTEVEAIRALKNQPVDVIILDLHLKEGTGFGVMRAILHSLMKPQIIVLTNYDLPEYKKAAVELGAAHFLDKARDYTKVPQLLQDMRRAQHMNH